MERIGRAQFASLFRSGTPFLDVRAPVEFAEGSIPGAVNLPLLTDDERARVGTTYKQQGSDAAVALGHELVNGAVKSERVQRWVERIAASPETVIYCFRGGLRSQISQAWLAEAGLRRPIIEGGYKALRRFLMETLESEPSRRNFFVVGGATGSGKTDFLSGVKSQIVDLEAHARHRGSAFGALAVSQPSQIDFENAIAVSFLQRDDRTILAEDESRMIGQRVVPEKLFNRLKTSPMILLNEPLENRLARLMEDYVFKTPIAGRDEREISATYAKYRAATNAVSSKLGGLRTSEILRDLALSESERLSGAGFESNRVWIRKLLEWYYDPMYARGLEKRDGKIVFRGSRADALEWWNAEIVNGHRL